MNNDQLLRLIVDNRESELIKLLEAFPEKFIIETQQLSVADIVVSSESAIERKAKADFITSLIDGRLFEQLLRLVDAYPNCVLILEAFDDEVLDNTGVNLRSVYGALTYVSYRMGVAVIPTRNLEESLIVIERIAFREQVEDKKPVLSRRAKKGMSIRDRREYMIESLIDTGPSKAKTLIDAYITPERVIQAIRDTEVVYTKTGNPKGILGPLETISGFGCKFIDKNKKLLFG
jgi:Fanconi anemia group M protein